MARHRVENSAHLIHDLDSSWSGVLLEASRVFRPGGDLLWSVNDRDAREVAAARCREA